MVMDASPGPASKAQARQGRFGDCVELMNVTEGESTKEGAAVGSVDSCFP